MKHIFLLVGVLTLFASCGYQEIADADFPDQTIYMPAAANGIFQVNKVPESIGNTTPGSSYRYTIDFENGTFTIPMSVYRAGINNGGAFSIELTKDTDTITKLVTAGKLPNTTLLLPSDKIMMPNAINLSDGAEIASFDMVVDLDFLKSNLGKAYATAVNIASSSVKTNPKLETTIVLIDTDFMLSNPSFTFQPKAEDDKTLQFTNTSTNAVDYLWDFGDGKTSTEKNPNHTYSNYGEYTVTLKTTGVLRTSDETSQNLKLWQNVTNTYIKNPGFPFMRSDTPDTRFGILQNWEWTSNILSQENKTKGGYSWDNGGVLHYESTNWGGDGLTNGKIYQTFTLPAGDYKASFTVISYGCNASPTIQDMFSANFVVSKGNILSDIENLEGSDTVARVSWGIGEFGNDSQHVVEFTISQPTEVSLGFVCTYGTLSYMRIGGVSLSGL